MKNWERNVYNQTVQSLPRPSIMYISYNDPDVVRDDVWYIGRPEIATLKDDRTDRAQY